MGSRKKFGPLDPPDAPAFAFQPSEVFCKKCKDRLSTAEVASYQSFCEDCWTGCKDRMLGILSMAERYGAKYSPEYMKEIRRAAGINEINQPGVGEDGLLPEERDEPETDMDH